MWSKYHVVNNITCAVLLADFGVKYFIVFDKVWHKGLIFKLKQNGISGNVLKAIINFQSFRKQRVVLNRQVS